MKVYIKTKKHCIKWNVTKCIKNIASIVLFESVFVGLVAIGLIKSGIFIIY